MTLDYTTLGVLLVDTPDNVKSTLEEFVEKIGGRSACAGLRTKSRLMKIKRNIPRIRKERYAFFKRGSSDIHM